MAARDVLKNINLFVDGRGYAGQLSEYSPPSLALVTEDFRAGVKGKRGEGHCKRNKRNQTPFRLEMAYLSNFTKRSRKNWGSPRP
ncbi:hypothetical protein HEQ62_10815 [Haematospirillum jordaniae]|uniref:Uncharacterized protein n=2 Tax=Haematospirillum jordaniae TaxID=1549855 RepID=A0A143DGN7_9PROT|nr:phage major tail tube protein [Haematospirillum jordaniae]AMW35750.1 hypothetical protein AY555_10225 [Haematospirillum jordaniae]AMW35944.1 hypothetical protein AY555_11340 [Haematospirillum jordaniae]NKD46278.1 hypothetical protein [Haematospirillum jordaniae]NKD60253.1 hypothetical protein [Haematospirillum jordaniae]NKD68190.1 hypothetical protein [Haematospirillum jordaniae]